MRLMSPSNELSIHELARLLGLDRKIVRRNIAAGMPRKVDGARAWRSARVRPYLRPTRCKPSLQPVAGEFVNVTNLPKVVPLLESGEQEPAPRLAGGALKLLKADAGEDLSAVVQWLRDLTKSYWAATTEALASGDVARADALAKQLQSLTRNLAGTEATAKKLAATYGGLVSRDTMVRWMVLYKRAIDSCVIGLPESRERQELIETLDRITLELSADLKLDSLIA